MKVHRLFCVILGSLMSLETCGLSYTGIKPKSHFVSCILSCFPSSVQEFPSYVASLSSAAFSLSVPMCVGGGGAN